MQNSALESRLKETKHEEFIGLEYVIEVNNGITFEPVFYCILCDDNAGIRMEMNIVVAHLTAFNHRLKYLEKHFPTSFEEISVLKSDKRKCKTVLEKLCEAIEEMYGRLSVLVVENNDFVKNRMKYTEQALHTTHFDENMGCTFTELIRNEGESLTSSLLDSKYRNLDRRHSLASSCSNFKTPDDVIVASRRLGRYSTSTPSTSNCTPFTNLHRVAPKFERFNSYSERRQKQMYKIGTFRHSSTDLIEKTRYEQKRGISEFTSEERKNDSREWSSEEESPLRESRSNSLSERPHRRPSPKGSRSYKEFRSCRRSRSPEPYRATPAISPTASRSLKQARLSPRMSYSSERFEHQPNYYGYIPNIGSWRKSTSAQASMPTLLDYQPFNAPATFSIPKDASLSYSNAEQSTIPFNLHESGSNKSSSSYASGNKENIQLEIAKRISSAYFKIHHKNPTKNQLTNMMLEYEKKSEAKKNSGDNDKIGSGTLAEQQSQHSSVKEINEIRTVSPVDVLCIEDNEELDERISEVSNYVPSTSLSPKSSSASVPFLIPQSLRKEIYSTCPTSSDIESDADAESNPCSLTYKELKNLISHYESLTEDLKKTLQKQLRTLEKGKSKILEKLKNEYDLSKICLWECQ